MKGIANLNVHVYKKIDDQYGNTLLFEIVVPTKVTRSVLENAASVASMALTTKALITDKKEPPVQGGGGMPEGGMGGMY